MRQVRPRKASLQNVGMTPEVAIRFMLETASSIVNEEINQSLIRLGEECITRIRTRSKEESWIDQTGNLRSSIGYAVFQYGLEVMESTFAALPGHSGNGQGGATKGREYIKSLSSQFSQTYALVVVAGMDYAEYVEAMENKDVLASTEIWAKKRINQYLNDAKDRAEARINSYLNSR